MEQRDQLRFACAACGQIIGYAPVQAGRTCICPKCGETCQLPPAPASIRSAAPPVVATPGPPPLPALEGKLSMPRPTMAKTEESPIRKCPTCGCPLMLKDVKCPVCEGRKSRKRATLTRLAILAVAVVAASAAAVISVKRVQAKRRAADPYQNIHSAVEGPLPQPKVTVDTPKSLNDLKIRTFAIQKRPNDPTTLIVGDIENDSEHLHRRITVELEVLNAQGLKIETLSEYVVDLPAHLTWHVISKTLNPNAASVRVGGIKEE